jgi:hypothetical protein
VQENINKLNYLKKILRVKLIPIAYAKYLLSMYFKTKTKSNIFADLSYFRVC